MFLFALVHYSLDYIFICKYAALKTKFLIFYVAMKKPKNLDFPEMFTNFFLYISGVSKKGPEEQLLFPRSEILVSWKIPS